MDKIDRIKKSYPVYPVHPENTFKVLVAEGFSLAEMLLILFTKER
jgi:hypothetical protein